MTLINPFVFAAAPLTYDDIVLSDSPSLYLPLDDTSGTTAVALAGSNGTYTNGPTLNVAGPTQVGSTGITLDGTNDFVALNASSLSMFNSPNSFTMEAWIKTTTSSTGAVMSVSSTTAADNYIEMAVSSGKVYGITRNGGGASFVFGTSNVNDNVWRHIAITVVGTTVTVFVNGTQENSAASGTRPGSLNRANIGHLERSTGVVDRYPGSVAAAAYYPVALASGRIAAHAAGA